MRTIFRFVVAAVVIGIAYWIWVEYESADLNRRVAPLRALIKSELGRFEAAAKNGTKFEPLTCSGSCSQEFLESYVVENGNELLFTLRGHPDFFGKTVRYRPMSHKTPTDAAYDLPILWGCESTISWPALSRFPWCV